MDRKIDAQLDAWKDSAHRKPLVLLGARQTGKTTSLLAFGKRRFSSCIHVDFVKSPQLKAAFDGSLEPAAIIANLSALMRCDITADETLLVFDEVQECERAIASLKYFCADVPEYAVCAAGSLLGVYLARERESFPVGYVDIRTMHPMDMEEFCWALGDKRAFDLARGCMPGMAACAAHDMLLGRYREYLMVGGMPEVVASWAESQSLPRARVLQSAVSTGYVADMSKHAANADAGRVYACWESLPGQLAKESGSTKFAWKTVGSGAKAATHRSALDWLSAAGIVNLVTQVECMETPLKSFENPSSFKAYVADTGLLACAYDAVPQDIEGKGPRTARFRGGIAENYVAQQLAAADMPCFYWGTASKAEVEFVIVTKDGAVPVEVKSGANTRAVSLKNAARKYGCPYVIKVSQKNFGLENGVLSVPLYAAGLIAEI